MEMIVHYPSTEKELIALSDRVATLHAEYIYSYLGKENFSKEEKLQIIENLKNMK